MKSVLLFLSLSVSRPDTLRLTLQEAVDMAKTSSIAAKQAATLKETKYWQWRTYKSNYQPQLSLTGDVPAYTKTFEEVVQPNGTILFQNIHNDNSSAQLNFSQSITSTGGSIYGETSVQRYDDLDGHTVSYNGVPYAIGYTQPLFQYNSLKWDNRIQPLKYRESKQAYLESLEQLSVTIEGYFFDLLLSQVNLQVAQNNLENTERILKIANTKFDLGKISQNEILQLKLERLNAQKAVGIAKRDMEIATLTLRSNIGLEGNDEITLIPPSFITAITISADKVLSEAYANRSDAIAFVRRVAEAKRDVALARGQNGIMANLTANLGYSKSAANIPDLYQSPQNQQLLQLQFTVPILDWGRAKARIRTAEANEQLAVYTVEQDEQTFKQQIVTQVSLFDLMKDQIGLTAEADSIAGQKYRIAQNRYVLGDLSITDLSIAFQENDQAQRDYISALRDFWGAWYQLRYLSLYDFEKNKKIL